MKKLIGIEFIGGNRSCTKGEPNPRTGNLSKAVNVKVFDELEDLMKWIEAPCNNERIEVTKTNLRKYHQGMSLKDYQEYLNYINL